MQISSFRQSNKPHHRHYLNYYRLGATLYTPATLPKLSIHLNENKYNSMVLCTEDSLHEHEVEFALNNIAEALLNIEESETLRFIRPRNIQVLRTLLTLPGIENIDGFVLPKVDLKNITQYAQILKNHPFFSIMPTLETEIVFNHSQLLCLRDELDKFPCTILCLRIGGNDLFHLLKIKRPRYLSIYDTPVRQAIDNCITLFKPHNYQLSAPVYEYIGDGDLAALQKELETDVAYGFFAKTAIHPSQTDIIQTAFKVARADVETAKKILDPASKAVFKHYDQMCESATHSSWAQETLLRYEYYGARF